MEDTQMDHGMDSQSTQEWPEPASLRADSPPDTCSTAASSGTEVSLELGFGERPLKKACGKQLFKEEPAELLPSTPTCRKFPIRPTSVPVQHMKKEASLQPPAPKVWQHVPAAPMCV